MIRRLHPQPAPRASGTSARCPSAPTRCASSPASSRPSCSTEKRWVARGGAPGDVARHRRLGGAVRDRRRPALPRDLQPAAYFGDGGHPLRALRHLGGRPRHLGRRSRSAGSAPGSPAAARGIPLPAFADALAPGLLVAQAIGRLGNWFNNELYGGPTDLPWGLKIYEWNGGQAARRRRRPARSCSATSTRRSSTSCCGTSPRPPFVIWADRRFRLGHGRAFALYVASYCARPALDRAAAHRPGRALLRRPAQRVHLDHRRPGAPSPTSSRMRGRPREVIHRGRRAAATPADPGERPRGAPPVTR